MAVYECAGTVTSAGHNLESTTPSQCGLNLALGDLIGANPLLGPLQFNGGPMQTQTDQLIGPTRNNRLLSVAVDARRGSVYLQLFSDMRDAAEPPRLLAADEAANSIGQRSVIVVGDGAGLVADAVEAAGGQAQAIFADLQPDARSLALLAADLAPAQTLRPLYLRPPDVKPQADRSLPRAVS